MKQDIPAHLQDQIDASFDHALAITDLAEQHMLGTGVIDHVEVNGDDHQHLYGYATGLLIAHIEALPDDRPYECRHNPQHGELMLWSPGMPVVSCRWCALVWYSARTEEEGWTCDRCKKSTGGTAPIISFNVLKSGLVMSCGHPSATLQIVGGLCKPCDTELRALAEAPGEL